MSERQTTKLLREGDYIAEVDVTLIEDEHEWSPYLAPDDVRKVDDVRLALRAKDFARALKLARIYEMRPVAAE